jgi:hypothetical protein
MTLTLGLCWNLRAASGDFQMLTARSSSAAKTLALPNQSDKILGASRRHATLRNDLLRNHDGTWRVY